MRDGEVFKGHKMRKFGEQKYSTVITVNNYVPDMGHLLRVSSKYSYHIPKKSNREAMEMLICLTVVLISYHTVYLE